MPYYLIRILNNSLLGLIFGLKLFGLELLFSFIIIFSVLSLWKVFRFWIGMTFTRANLLKTISDWYYGYARNRKNIMERRFAEIDRDPFTQGPWCRKVSSTHQLTGPWYFLENPRARLNISLIGFTLYQLLQLHDCNIQTAFASWEVELYLFNQRGAWVPVVVLYTMFWRERLHCRTSRSRILTTVKRKTAEKMRRHTQ